LQLWDNFANRPQNDKLPAKRSRIEKEVERARGQRATDHASALCFMIYYPLIGRSEIIVTLLKLLDDGVYGCQHLVLPTRVYYYLLFCFCDEWNNQSTSEILFRTAVNDCSRHFRFDSFADPLGRDTPATTSAISDLNKHILLCTVAPHLLNITQTQIAFQPLSPNLSFLLLRINNVPLIILVINDYNVSGINGLIQKKHSEINIRLQVPNISPLRRNNTSPLSRTPTRPNLSPMKRLSPHQPQPKTPRKQFLQETRTIRAPIAPADTNFESQLESLASNYRSGWESKARNGGTWG
jgi:hypothetical protein